MQSKHKFGIGSAALIVEGNIRHAGECLSNMSILDLTDLPTDRVLNTSKRTLLINGLRGILSSKNKVFSHGLNRPLVMSTKKRASDECK